jgi:drug/metabolite transporter (DMT)-like permease
VDIGLALALLTGCIWAMVACGYSAAARRKLAVTPFVAIAASTGAVLSGIFTVHWTLMSTWHSAIAVAAVISLSGLIGQSCMVFYGAAMIAAPEHSAATWTIVQTAMILPFLASTLTGREHASWINWLALPVILIAFRGLTPPDEGEGKGMSNRRLWLALLVTSFLLSGVSQALAQEISLRDWPDTLNLRPMLSLGIGGAFLWVMSGLRKERPTRAHWIVGFVTGCFVCVGNVILFRALDACASTGRAYLVFPMAVGSSILAFAAYQLIRRREKFNANKLMGLTCGLVGIVLLGLRCK